MGHCRTLQSIHFDGTYELMEAAGETTEDPSDAYFIAAKVSATARLLTLINPMPG